jgi:hypothetical protein
LFSYHKNTHYLRFESTYTQNATTGLCWCNGLHHARGIEGKKIFKSSHYGFRGVYTLGNNYFVVDHLTEIGLPSSISLATSWNMPKNSVAIGDSG